jgi:peptidoglycan hydrolase CwlO-like protein
MAVLEEIKATKKDLISSYEDVTKAHKTFITRFNSFSSLTDQLETKFKELEVREAAVQKREKENEDKNQLLLEREKKCGERELQVAMRESEVSVKEEGWRETEKKMQQNAAKLPNVIHLNISMSFQNYFTSHLSFSNFLEYFYLISHSLFCVPFSSQFLLYCRWNKVYSGKRNAPPT